MNAMSAAPGGGVSARFQAMMTWVVIVAGLYMGQDILIPIAVSVLVSFLLAPVANLLERWRLGRIPAAAIVICAALILVGGIGTLVLNQFVDVAAELPRYRGTIIEKIQSLKPSPGSTVQRIGSDLDAMVTEVSEQLKPARKLSESADPHQARNASETTPVVRLRGESQDAPNVQRFKVAPPKEEEPTLTLVRMVEEPSTSLQTAAELITPAASFAGKASLVIVFALFFLIQREDLRDRLLRLAGQGRMRITTSALDDAGARVSRYLLMQLLVNVGYGIQVCFGLWLIGIPNALLWGAFGAVLRFIPYLGPWIGAALPIMLSIAIFDSWTPTLVTIGMFVVIEIIGNNVIEPYLYGHNTGVSPVAIIMAAAFWTWLWGLAGLLLATPITVCLVVLGRHIPQLAFLDILLGNEPALPPDVRMYNRLLGGNLDDALEIAESAAKEQGIAHAADAVIVPALALVEHDKASGMLTPDRAKDMAGQIDEIYGEMKKSVHGEEDKAAAAAVSNVAGKIPRRKVLCVPAHHYADEAVARILAGELETAGHEAKALPIETLTGEILEEIKAFPPDVLVISALPPLALSHAKYLCKRLREAAPEVRIVFGLWLDSAEKRGDSLRRQELEGGQTVRSLAEAIRYI